MKRIDKDLSLPGACDDLPTSPYRLYTRWRVWPFGVMATLLALCGILSLLAGTRLQIDGLYLLAVPLLLVSIGCEYVACNLPTWVMRREARRPNRGFDVVFSEEDC